jgi:hypothetical protein
MLVDEHEKTILGIDELSKHSLQVIQCWKTGTECVNGVGGYPSC